MAKIALVMPRSTFLETPLVWQPLGLFYISARLESLGHSVDFFDLNEDTLPPDGEYSQLWVSATAPQIAEVRRIAQETMGWKTKRVLGGAVVWANPDSCRDMGYDLLVGGESDQPGVVEQLIDTAEHCEANTYIPIATSHTLDWVLAPSRKWSHKYHAQMPDASGKVHTLTTMFTTRGCPLTCAFCESGRLGVIWDKHTRYEPLPIVEQQIREIADLGYSGIGYYDDVMPLNKPRTLAIMDLHKKYNMVWRGFVRTDIVCNHGGFEYMRALRDGGLIEIFVGVESADNRIKNGIFKKTTIEQDTQVLEWCKQLGIRMKCSFILGLPGESRESMERTREWILTHRPHRAQIGRLIPFAGTPLGDHPEMFDITYERQPSEDWYYSGNNTHSFVSTSNLTRQEIDDYYHALMAELKQEGIPS